MKCDHPKSETIESRVRKDGLRYRRRYCCDCLVTFATVEVATEVMDEMNDMRRRLRAIAEAVGQALAKEAA